MAIQLQAPTFCRERRGVADTGDNIGRVRRVRCYWASGRPKIGAARMEFAAPCIRARLRVWIKWSIECSAVAIRQPGSVPEAADKDES